MFHILSITTAMILAIDPGAPKPKIWQVGDEDVLNVAQPIQVVVADDAKESEIGGIETLINIFEMRAQIVKASAYHSGTAIFIGEPGRLSSLAWSKVADKLNLLPKPGKEGFRMVVDSDGIILAGTDPLGTRHGLNHLVGLLDQGMLLPELYVQDEPDIAMRIIPRFSMDSMPVSLAHRPNAVIFPVTETQLNNLADAERRAKDFRSVGLEPVITLNLKMNVRNAWLPVLDTLQPRYLLLSQEKSDDWPECTSAHTRLSECVAKHIDDWVDFVNDVRPGMKILIQADIFMPFSNGGMADTYKALDQIPEGIWLFVTQAGDGVDRTIRWLNAQNKPFVIAATPNPNNSQTVQNARIYELLKFARSNQFLCKGIGALNTSVDTMVLQHAWNLDNTAPLWPSYLNTFFDSDLGQPDPEEVMKSLIDYYGVHILDGKRPNDIGKHVDDFLSSVSLRAPQFQEDIRRLQKLMHYISEYGQLEWQYVDDPSKTFFDELVDFVQRWGDEAQWPKERTAIIVETIQTKKVMVPASIFFGLYVTPYRPDISLSSGTVLPLPAEVTQNQAENFTEMKLHTGVLPIAPVRRFEFETVGGASILVENSQDDGRYRTAFFETTEVTGGMRAPVTLDDTLLAPWWTFKVNAPYERSHLRSFQAWAWKPPATAKAASRDKSISIDGYIEEGAWDFNPQIFGFVDSGGHGFSTFPTTIKLSRQNASIYMAVQAVPQIDGEELTLLIQPPNKKNYRVRLTLSETQAAIRFTRNGLPIPGFADAALRQKGEIWVSEIRIPLSNLGVSNDDSASWKFNALRLGPDNQIQSMWAPVESSIAPLTKLGTLTF
jgi:hypothetical protein